MIGRKASIRLADALSHLPKDFVSLSKPRL
jgi:hypothetical protein